MIQDILNVAKQITQRIAEACPHSHILMTCLSFVFIRFSSWSGIFTTFSNLREKWMQPYSWYSEFSRNTERGMNKYTIEIWI